jgi:hypothetical protein
MNCVLYNTTMVVVQNVPLGMTGNNIVPDVT